MLNLTRKQLGFTLLELMVAVVVLLVIMIAVGRIFSTTSDISSSGQAISETLQQGVAVEQQLREDISKVSREGFFAIRSVAVANNLRGEFLLLDPSLPSDELIRFDQLVFFTDGIASSMINNMANNTDFAGQALASMVYYGHGVRFPQLEGLGQGIDNDVDESNDPILIDQYSYGTPLITPWYQGPVEVETRRYTDSQNTRFDQVADGFYIANGSQGSPSEWTLCRQSILLGDDDQEGPADNRKKAYMRAGISSNSIFPWDPRIGGSYFYPHINQGRVDIAATQLDDIRQSVLQEVESGGIPPNREWRYGDSEYDQQELIGSLFYWPRVEPYPPTAIRYDQALMLSALAEGCVSFKIEWTYDDGVGEAIDANYNFYNGYSYNQNSAQPWFGEATASESGDIGNSYVIDFDTLSDFTFEANAGNNGHLAAATVDPSLIEPFFSPDDGPLLAPVPVVQTDGRRSAEYWSIFGYNGTSPFLEDGLSLANDDATDNGDIEGGDLDDGLFPGDSTWRYTPWPSALRITMRLVDRENRLGAGWTYQFIVDLPERKE